LGLIGWAVLELEDEESQVQELKKLITSLPEPNKKTLQHILKMCSKIDEQREVNKVTGHSFRASLLIKI